METALSTLSLLPSGKEQVMTFKKMLKNEILSGSTDPLKTLVQLKYIEKTIADTLVDAEIERCFVNEFEKYGKEKIVEMNGAKLTEQETGVKYDYESCGDPVYFDLKKQIDELTAKIKERQEFLKVLPSEGTVDPATGVFINPPPKSSKTKITVRI